MRFVGTCLVLVLAACDCAEGGGGGGGDVDASGERDGGDGTDAAFDAGGGEDDAGIDVDAGPRPDGGGETPRECGEETCYDGLDGDCDGIVDDDCPCVPGEVGACFRGDPRHRGLGACRDGMFVCTGSFEFGTWGPCEGDVIESAEVCDTAGVDEDCDGAANEDCECVEGDPPIPCGTDVGNCELGMQQCVGGRRTACEGGVGPARETCDAADEDCDSRVDEDVRRACGITEGVCRPGFEVCADGAWGACEGGVEPGVEACDGLDDDCDGAIDEMISRTCGSDTGRCVAGTETCAGGAFGACEGRVDPIAETCNGVDDDCDGATDEMLVRSCGTTDLGACSFGTETCDAGVWGPCTGAIEPGTEVCDGSTDEDCDGMADEGCECATGATRACGTDVGACVAGTETCDALGRWGACTGSVGPRAEECNALDDDCDGATDEMLTRTCGTTDVGACRLGTETCSLGSWSSCTGAIEPIPERCEGTIDEDCDGATDEGCMCVTGAMRPCGSDVGACIAGTQRCDASGMWGACTGEVGPTPERCDGVVDDDCDGIVDEGCTCVTGRTRSCGTDVGACVAGTETCDAAGAWGPCTGSVGPGVETCNAVDDDCDGSTDEMLSRACGTDTGACMRGTETCAAGAWIGCTAIGPTTEVCDGVVDEDCDGTTDEGCLCTDGMTRSCGTDVGACVAGTERCNLMGMWGACMGSVGPTPETCNAIDDDCDGMTDEGACMPPTVTCPGARMTTVGTAVSLMGSGSDPDGGTVTYMWTVVTRPVGSSANPMPAGAATTSFTPDAAGSYTLRLCVTDDEGEVSCCTTTVTAASTCTPPAVPTLTGCGTSWDRRPLVEFAPLPSGVTLSLYKDADVMPYATITRDGQNYYRPDTDLGTGSPPPGTAMTIYARACLDADPTCCSTSATITVRLIVACTTPVAPSSSNIVFSEYVTDGDGTCPGPQCEAGEAIEITNLSHCPVALAGHHFGYCNASCSASSVRWMNFGAADVVPPRGVYIAIRQERDSMCAYPFFGPDDPGLFGLKISTLAMMGDNLASGWFNNTTGGTFRIATGAFVDMTSGTTIEIINPYLTSAGSCESIGFDAYNACGDISGVSRPTTVLMPNQLGRLWRPCDAVVAPDPAMCR